MKMSLKLILLFSVMTIIVTTLFSISTYQTNLTNLQNTTNTSLTAICTKMKDQIEQYVKLMNYAIDELSSNIEFMDNFNTISTNKDDSIDTAFSPALTRMSQLLYQAPLQAEFLRVCAFNEDGFFITNVFEKTKSIDAYSDEVLETVASMEYLAQLKKHPFSAYINSVIIDPWNSQESVVSFSLTKAAVWHGRVIGYFQVLSSLDDLANIFFVQEKTGVSSQAIFDDGRDLFRTWKDDIIYEDLPIGTITTVKIDGASDRWVIREYSELLHLNIYASQEIDAFGSNRIDILKKSFHTMLPILLISLALIILISYGLTRSIRKLSQKITELPANNFLSRSDLNDPTVVVNPRDREMYELEQSFNNMLTNLRESHANEVVLREGTLKAQLNALQLQINPHFIYNTLNIISAKGLESGNEEISELCDQFAQMLRYSTDVRSETSTINEEIDNANRYLYLCKTRFEDTFEYTIDVPDQLLDITIPKLTLQPIIENSIKYGVRNANKTLKIEIKGYSKDNELKLIIKDNGDGFNWDTLNNLQRAFRKIELHEVFDEPTTRDRGLGLINTYRRLFYYSRGTMKINLYNDNGAVVELTQTMNGEKQDV